MAYKDPARGSLKRKRARRRPDKPPIAAHVHLDYKLKGDVALLSDDLIADLFPADAGEPGAVYHVAVTAYTAVSVLSTTATQWVIIPCRRLPRGHPVLPHSSLRLSTASRAAQAFQSLTSHHAVLRSGTSIEVRVADFVPLHLDTVFVTLNAPNVTANQPETNGLKHRGKRATNNGRNDAVSKDTVENHTRRVKEALSSASFVRAGDSFPLSASATSGPYATGTSATITDCEPVAQGLMSANTRVVVVSQTNHNENRAKFASPRSGLADGDEETSNESFFTAAEDGHNTSETPLTDGETTSDDMSPSDSDADLSDDFDDIISLNSPAITSQPSGFASALTVATPRPLLKKANGINTPGSVYSSMTTNTLRAGPSGRVKTFRVQGLVQRIPDELLHPKPSDRDDEEARVLVETSALGKLGCFSGDWVHIQGAREPNASDPLNLTMSLFDGGANDDGQVWRPVRIYALPETLAPKPPRYLLGGKGAKRESSMSTHLISPTAATLYLSPVLLANMGEPPHVTVSPLPSPEPVSSSRSLHPKSRPRGAAMPPIAAEVSLMPVLTPLSTERSLQPSLSIRLRDYFEQKQRIVKSGDLLAIPIDQSLGRVIFQGGAADEENKDNDLLSRPTENLLPKENAVAWFKIRTATSHPPSESQYEDQDWGGVVMVDPSETRMSQSPSEQMRLPGTIDNVWQFYEGVRKAPAGSTNGPLSSRSPPQSHVTQLQRRLRELILAATSLRATHLGLPPIAILLTSTQRNIGKAHTVAGACLDLGMHYFQVDAYDTLSQSAGGGNDSTAEIWLKARAKRAFACGAQYTALLIRHIEALASDRMASALKEILADSRVLIATSTEVDKIPDNIRALFTHELDMTAPDEAERESILRSIIAESGVSLSPSVDLSSVAVKTAALVAGDLVDVTERAILNQTSRLEKLADTASISGVTKVTLRDIQLSGGDATVNLTPVDFDEAVDDARKNFADAIGAPKIPNVQWSDVGGLSNVKEAVIETIQLPLSRPELFAKGLKKRSGILFYGPPGTGKTLLAKAIATEFSLNFFSVKGPELLNMYIGESEANVRRVFQRARDARPCCVFFDELDSVAPKRGNQGDSGGVMDRIVSQLLAELDGMSDGEDGGGGVFVIGATNRPDLLDQALLRPGRFDKMLYLGVSDTHPKQLNILQALTRKFTLSPELSLSRVAERLPFTYTGADFYALCSDAMLKAITRSARLVDSRVAAINADRAAQTPPKPPVSVAYFFDHDATEQDTRVVVAEEDFYAAGRELVPSVSVEELKHYERVRREFEGAKEAKAAGAGESAAAQPAARLDGVAAEVADTQRAKMMARMQRLVQDAQRSRDGSSGMANGEARAKDPGDGVGVDDEDEDDYIIKTDRLSLNGSGKEKEKENDTGMGHGEGKGKGKATNGKGPVEQHVEDSTRDGFFGDAAAADEDMYA